ncbi:MAG: PQQ-binding-like beta-propeller repeat protein [Haloferacaceae archaeon]
MPARRTVLRSTALVAAGLAGCSSTGGTDDRCGTDPPPAETRGVLPADGNLPAIAADATWPQPGFDPANTRFNPDAVGPTERPRLYWSLELDAPPRRGAGPVVPVVADGVVFVVDGYHRPVAVDARTGEVAWRLDDLPTPNPVAVAGDRLYLGSAEGLHAVSVADRTVAWTFTPPELEGGDATTARTRPPPRTAAEDETASPPPEPPATASTPVPAGDAIYVGTGTNVYAVDRASGEERWRVAGDEVAAVTGDAVFVYDAGTVRAVSPGDGTVRWESPGVTDVPSVAVADGRLYGSPDLGVVAAFDAATGDERWRFEGEVESMATPTVTPDAVYAGSSPLEGRDGGNLYALDPATGDPLWCSFLGFASVAAPAATPDTVFVPQSDGLLQARERAERGVRWQFFERSAWFSAAAAVDGALFVGTEDGRCYAFGDAGE